MISNLLNCHFDYLKWFLKNSQQDPLQLQDSLRNGGHLVDAKLIFIIIIINYVHRTKQCIWNFSMYQNHMTDLLKQVGPEPYVENHWYWAIVVFIITTQKMQNKEILNQINKFWKSQSHFLMLISVGFQVFYW